MRRDSDRGNFIKKISTTKGVYIVYYKDEIIYIGKTTHTGKVRLNEMGSDFRSHTLNRKLLLEELKNKNKFKYIKEDEPNSLEHFLIAIFDPKYND